MNFNTKNLNMLSQLVQKLPCLPFLFAVLAVLMLLSSFGGSVERLKSDSQPLQPQNEVGVTQVGVQVSYQQ
ncbi:hypothetical protein R9C00_22770 [Flammeovirgaceae bacterium SG7u.111]|nr:hypothetical protein [Flammeovirgaceae bacterium SG7u.132]WPO34528.1 hypothetical protein R9C00_22770 [Flammeovirgaceae bacterium SG7u.111]